MIILVGIVIFVLLIFLGIMGHISKSTDIGCGYVTFYVLCWIGSICWLCASWSDLHGFFITLLAIFGAFIAPFVIHICALILKEFVIWALKGLGD